MFHSWIPAAVLRDYFTVQEDERLDYSIAWDNDSVHPPLYFAVLHTVCSFFPNQYNKWFGLSINLVFYVITLFGLFLLSDYLFKSKLKALLTVAVYAFSLGAVNSFLMVRPYMMLTALSVFALYSSVKCFIENRTRYLYGVLLSFFLAGMTQYFFWILGFFITVIYILVSRIGISVNKRIVNVNILVNALSFSLTALASFVVAGLCDPNTFRIFSGGGGPVNLTVMNSSALRLAKRIVSRFILCFNDSFFNIAINIISLSIVIFSFALLCILARKFGNKIRSQSNKHYRMAFVIAFLSCFLCAFVVLLIEPFNVDRYIFYLYPAWAIFIVAVISFGWKKIRELPRFMGICFCIFFSISFIVSNICFNTEALNRGGVLGNFDMSPVYNNNFFKESWYIYEEMKKVEEFNASIKDAYVFYYKKSDFMDHKMHELFYIYEYIKELYPLIVYQDIDYKRVIVGQIVYHIPRGERIIVIDANKRISEFINEKNNILMVDDKEFVFMLKEVGYKISLIHENIGHDGLNDIYQITPID